MVKRFLVAAGTIGWLALGSSAAVAADTDVVLSGGPHSAERASDGTTTLSLTAINLTTRDVTLRLVPNAPGCDATTGTPGVRAQTSSKVTFTTICDRGEQSRGATVRVRYTNGGGHPATRALPIEFTVAPHPDAQWSQLWWFVAGIPLAILFVLIPYGYWVARPEGNVHRRRTEPQAPEGAVARGLLATAWERVTMRLPGIGKDWSLTDSWSSNVTLGAGLFTALLASTGPATAILGEEALGPLAVVTVAAAFAAAVVATGPLWLVICKRRWEDDPAAQLNTVAGVLVATVVVLSASLGLIITLAVLVDRAAVYVLAVAAIALLAAYSAKSVPMTLALGAHAEDRAAELTGGRAPTAMP